jgi:hypothetical protein
MERKNKVFLVHLSSLKTKKLFTSSDKKEDRAKEQEKYFPCIGAHHVSFSSHSRCCKSVLAWFGRRMGTLVLSTLSDFLFSLLIIPCSLWLISFLFVHS